MIGTEEKATVSELMEKYCCPDKKATRIRSIVTRFQEMNLK